MYILRRELDRLKDRINFAQGQEEAMELKKEANEVMGKIRRIEDNIDAEDNLIRSNLGIPAITAPPTTPTTANSLTHPTSILTTPQYPIQSKPNSPSTPKPTRTDTSAPATPGTPTPQTRRKASAANGKGVQKLNRDPSQSQGVPQRKGKISDTETEEDESGRQESKRQRVSSNKDGMEVDPVEKSMESLGSAVCLSGLWSAAGSNDACSIENKIKTSKHLDTCSENRSDTLSNTCKLITRISHLSLYNRTKTNSPLNVNIFHSCTNWSNRFVWLILILVLMICPVSGLASSAPLTGISIFALNANGMNNILKIHHINTAIRAPNPSVFVISELKSKVPIAGRLPNDDYNILEEKSEPTDGTWKWGIAIGIRKDIQLAQRLQTQHKELKGRILAVDILLPSTNGLGFPHRIFGAYAPWDPGLKASFWEKITEICNNSPHSWSLIGDLNTTVSSIERANSENRSAYTKFLRDTGGLDIWKNYPLRNRLMDWTCRSKESVDGGSIIDRLVTSPNGIIEAHLQVASERNDYIPVTDHRPLIARVIPDVPNGSLPTTLKLISLPTPRIRYPKLDRKQKLQQFEEQTDGLAEAKGLFQMTVKDDTSFLTLYDTLTEILNRTAEQVFGRNQTYRRGTIRDVTSP